MNSPAVTPYAPSTRPALELIALARLSPEVARQKLRALLLANPNYFGKVPPTTFNAVLKIQEDTTYECISQVGFDPESERLRATIDIKKLFGYSGDALINGSEEFVRFYFSYDGGSNWLDQGMRSVTVHDAELPRPLAYDVSLPFIAAEKLYSAKILPKVRAILSWNSLPPAGAPNWSPVWGNVAESDIQIEDSQVIVSNKLPFAPKAGFQNATLQANQGRQTGFAISSRQGQVPSNRFPSSATDPEHRFLSYVFARAAGCCSSGSESSQSNAADYVHCDAVASTAFLPELRADSVLAAAS